MHREELKYLLPDYIAGMLSPDENAIIERELSHDYELGAEYKRLQSTFTLLDFEKHASVTPASVNSILVEINAKIDRSEKKRMWDFLPMRVLAPAAGLVAVVIIGILSLPDSEQDILPNGTTANIEQTLIETDPDLIAQLRLQAPDDILLSDVPIENTIVVLTGEEETAFEAAINEQLFVDIAYQDFVAATNEYLSTDEVLSALTSQSAGEILELIGDKAIL